MQLPETTPEAAIATLEQLGAARRRSRRYVGSLWLAMVVFGALTAIGAVLAGALSGHWVSAFWLVAGPVAGVAVTQHYRRRGVAAGFVGGRARWWVASGVLFAACFVSSSLVGLLAPLVVIPAGWLVIGRLQGTFITASVVAGVAAIALASRLAGIEDWQALAVFGAGQVVAGLVLRRCEAE